MDLGPSLRKLRYPLTAPAETSVIMKSKDLIVKSSGHASRDNHSFSEPDLVRMRHLDLELQVLFDRRILRGVAVITLQKPFSGELALDTRDLIIESAEYSVNAAEFQRAYFELGKVSPGLGAPLVIQLPEPSLQVRIRYTTGENASGLQWLDPAQTTGKTQP